MDTDPDLICALLIMSGYSQTEIDELAPKDCSLHWLSKKEQKRRLDEFWNFYPVTQ